MMKKISMEIKFRVFSTMQKYGYHIPRLYTLALHGTIKKLFVIYEDHYTLCSKLTIILYTYIHRPN